ncbi:NTP transferase domain-containing protein [Mucilaginibacter litoreus]|uniref:NTP transferase domain-containing protein n=1 Tax=Mucilaginibacter litoreus TaxID=1048221 RepID=A0ABW3ANX8_9SPHI
MTGLIILAAGASSRLGHPKQNLLYKGKTLLERAVDAGIRSPCRPVVVVLGANAEDITLSNISNEADLVYNKHWQQGQSASIKAGITELQKHPNITSAIMMLCDQPFVTSKLLSNMLQVRLQTQKPVVACSYNGTIGVPALFNKGLFGHLLSLSGNHGAKQLLQAQENDVAIVEFEEGSIDIDTLADYERLLGK